MNKTFWLAKKVVDECFLHSFWKQTTEVQKQNLLKLSFVVGKSVFCVLVKEMR
jgi:hypothetical protein